MLRRGGVDCGDEGPTDGTEVGHPPVLNTDLKLKSGSFYFGPFKLDEGL